jgi:hypothetical protein
LIQVGRKKIRRFSRIHASRESDGRRNGSVSAAWSGSLNAPRLAVTHSSFSVGSSR